MQAWPYYAYYPCAAHQCGWQASVFFHILEDLTIPCRGREAALAWASVSIHGWGQRKGRKKIETGKRGGGRQGREGRRGWWKIKPMPVWLPVAREVYLSFSSKALVDGGKDKEWAKEMLCLSLHWLLIYLCPILGNPCSRRLEGKASTRQFVQSGFITLDRTTNEPAKMSHLKTHTAARAGPNWH